MTVHKNYIVWTRKKDGSIDEIETFNFELHTKEIKEFMAMLTNQEKQYSHGFTEELELNLTESKVPF